MRRNLDIAALRALVTVAEMGGITRAAAQLNLTQSAVSLQIKRLEEALDQCLIDRVGRGVALTVAGERLVGYARRLLATNDEIVDSMAAGAEAGELRLGVPPDLLHLKVPRGIRDFRAEHPDIRVLLQPDGSPALRERLASGALDLIVTTEAEPGPGAETLAVLPLVWIGAPEGRAWRRRPLPLAAVLGCSFTPIAIGALTGAGLEWYIEGETTKLAVDGGVAADMAIHMMLLGTIPAGFEVIDHDGGLPALPEFQVAMYLTAGPRRAHAERLADRLRTAFSVGLEAAAE